MSRKDLANADKVIGALNDREKWRMAAAMTMSQQPTEIRQAIVTQGESEFLRVAKAGFRGQGFDADDLRFIYRFVLSKTQSDSPVILES